MKRFIIVPLMLTFAISAFGQSSKLTVGIESATTISSMRGDDPFDYSHSQVGYGLAVTTSYSILPYLSVSTGLGFERKGAKTEEFLLLYDYKKETEKIHCNFDYLILPIKASLQTGKRIKGYVNAGVFIGYLLSYSERCNEEEAPKLSKTSNFKRFDGGITVGIGAYVPLYKKITLDIGAVENLGLRNIISNNGDIKTNSVGILVGLKYTL